MFWMTCPSWIISGKQLALRHVLGPNRHPCGEPTSIKNLTLGFIVGIYLSTLCLSKKWWLEKELAFLKANHTQRRNHSLSLSLVLSFRSKAWHFKIFILALHVWFHLHIGWPSSKPTTHKGETIASLSPWCFLFVLRLDVSKFLFWPFMFDFIYILALQVWFNVPFSPSCLI